VRSGLPRFEKGNLDDFSRERFIQSVRGGRVRFRYRGAWREPHLMHRDACRRALDFRAPARMTAGQWSDAFKAAGCTEMETQRYVVRPRQKVDEGVALEGGSAK